MFARIRTLLLSIPVLAVVGVVAAYLLFAWFGFDPLVRWALPKFVAERSAHHLTIEHARFDPFRLTVSLEGVALSTPDGKPLLTLQRAFADFDAVGSVAKRAYVFDEVRLTAPVVDVELQGKGHVNWLEFVAALAGPPKEHAMPRLLLRHCVLEQGRVNFADRMVDGGFNTRIDPVQLELDDISTLPENRGENTLSARTGMGANVRWKGTIELNPLIATGEVAVDGLLLDRLWPYVKEELDIAPPEGTAAVKFGYRAAYANRHVDLTLDNIQASVAQLALRGPGDVEPTLMLASVQATGGRFDFGKRELALDALSVDGGRVRVELDAESRLKLRDWVKTRTAPTATAPESAASAAEPAFHYIVKRVGVEHLAVQVIDAAFVSPLTATVGQLGLDFGVEGIRGGEAPDLQVRALGLRLDDVHITSRDQQGDWARLASLKLEGGQLGLAARELTLEHVALKGARFAATRDAHGGLPFLDALRRVPAATAAPAAPAASTPAPAPRYRVDRVDLDDFEFALRDEAVSPPVQLDIVGLQAQVQGVSEKLAGALPVKVRFDVKQGGHFEAEGSVVPSAPSADLRVKLAALSLTPAQPYLAQKAALVLASGRVGTQGRVRLRSGQLRYEGGLAIDELLLNEERSGERLLGWKRLATDHLALAPGRLQLGEVALDGLDAKLVIFSDHSINVAKLIKTGATAPAAPATAAGRKAPPMSVDVERIRFADGKLDFADLSLVLPFAARIHDLKGDAVGLSSRRGSAAQVEFDGVVDEYGLARAVGQIQPFDPTALTDIKVVFRNVEMNSLTPYAATFAGRKIESGKLSLDLEYKLRERQLEGDNKVVMERLTLGERVQSPTAVNLPLDLAIAILEDSDGKIDLGLPVSGSLDDPKFSYGGIIWKAIVNVVTKIVTAPFRALGALLGISGDALEQVSFDAGSVELLPPEREKLAKLAEALNKRPALAVNVAVAFNPQSDAKAIKELRLRRAVAQQSGRTLAADEDPGPISTAQQSTREALEKLYAQRFGADALASLQQRYQQANPAPPSPNAGGRLVSRLSTMFTATPPPLSAEDEAKLRGADVHALMLQRLLDADVVDDEALHRIARERGEGIARELGTHGVAAERVHVADPQPQEGGAAVTAALKIEAGAKQAVAAAGAN